MINSYINDLKIKTSSPEAEVLSLSGGNQQKVVLAKWLATKPDLLILGEPTRGVDVGAKFEIYTIINTLAAEGIAILFISSELPEIINMCDSVCVIRSGKLVKKIPREQLSQEYIMQFAAGGEE
jgi:ribose transport system ATP-binding protein